MDKPANTTMVTRAARRPGRDGDTGGTVKTVPYGDAAKRRFGRHRGLLWLFHKDGGRGMGILWVFLLLYIITLVC
jgi:hypothetical protein